MKEMIMVLSKADKAALGTVRCLPGLQAAEAEEFIWVRGIAAQENIDIRIRQLPGVHTYLLDADNHLFPPGALTPVGRLQLLNWVPLPAFITVELPVSALPGKINQQHTIRLVPSRQSQAGNALLTDLDTWKAYGEQAPLVRLQQTRFAVSANNKVLIIGSPLPALPGKEYVLQDTLLLPCGYEFDPPAISNLVIIRLDPSKEALLLFDSNGTWEKIPKTAFVYTTRSAIRFTKGGNYE
ncbi:hypothetical protein A3860_15265 [Niastella vici]|uniref:MoxR-vWA-beta-propeller ternary system domain-containing protein n=1 Tax=Niastella vici TaxID=1703345 RepID=A0A1V9G5U0_9BACT|nr:hypothetical protein [Niastella vici]OQP65947.1 hypothetical protein A3860_15265 [Niastella vici]